MHKVFMAIMVLAPAAAGQVNTTNATRTITTTITTLPTETVQVLCLCPPADNGTEVNDSDIPTYIEDDLGNATAGNTSENATRTPTMTMSLSLNYSADCCPIPPTPAPPPGSSDDKWGGLDGWLWLIIGIAAGLCVMMIACLIMRKFNMGGAASGPPEHELGRPYELREEPIEEFKPGDSVEVREGLESLQWERGVVTSNDPEENGVWVMIDGDSKPRMFTELRHVEPLGNVQENGSEMAIVGIPKDPPSPLTEASGNYPQPLPAPASFHANPDLEGPLKISALRQVSSRPSSPLINLPPPIQNSINSSHGQSPFKSLPFEYSEPRHDSAIAPSESAKSFGAKLDPLV
eukprot:TRINITY_DN17414_c0_g1_i1.p1 TRINITY_DN17414_c0_g1~~TRINITY_DN17414_c0_g1_i1.p1  ORF type:complete len:348 (+),score=39.89 TRINITY_DN17414_c0_g1_i1:63-1106(+)